MKITSIIISILLVVSAILYWSLTDDPAIKTKNLSIVEKIHLRGNLYFKLSDSHIVEVNDKQFLSYSEGQNFTVKEKIGWNFLYELCGTISAIAIVGIIVLIIAALT